MARHGAKLKSSALAGEGQVRDIEGQVRDILKTARDMARNSRVRHLRGDLQVRDMGDMRDMRLSNPDYVGGR